MTFTPTNTTAYNGATATVMISVDPAAPDVSVNPVNLTYGTALANTQLGGTATWTVGGNVVTVPGSWTYTSAAGTVPNAGTGQSESVTFTPMDSADYSPVTTIVTVNVSPAALTITANNQNKVYGALPELTASYSGFVNGDTAASLTLPPKLSTTATTNSSVSGGPYTITASDAVDPNYTISYVAGTLAVTAASLTITADNQTKTYGEAFTFGGSDFTISGLVNGDTVTGVTLTSVGAQATAVASGSPYAITASGATGSGLSNYNITYASGTLTVEPAPLTITANNASMVAGQPIPTFSAKYSGFVLGQGPGVLSGSLAFNTPATPASPAGLFSIVPAGLSSSNYAITYVNGTLSVTAAPPPLAPLVTVTDLQWETFKVSRKKSIRELVVTFSGGLNPGNADDLAAYRLDSAVRKKKVTVYSKPVPLTSATYNAAANTVTLALRGKPPTKAMQLTIIAVDLLDAEGRELDGNNDGQPGGNFAATLNSGGVISMTRMMAESRVGRTTAVIDAVIADGSFRIIRKEYGHRRGAR